LSPAEVERFERIVNRSRPIQPGEHLFRAGDEFRTVASVRTGCFKSYVIDHEGQEQVLGFYLPGEVIGLDAIHSTTHTSNIVALDTGAVCSLTFDSVSHLARHMPDLQKELFRIMSHRIGELETFSGDLRTICPAWLLRPGVHPVHVETRYRELSAVGDRDGQSRSRPIPEIENRAGGSQAGADLRYGGTQKAGPNGA
jgi:CRP-like cAMP-binding protein